MRIVYLLSLPALASFASLLLHCGGAIRSTGNDDAGADTGTAGADAGVLADLCKLPKVVGPCEAAIAAWWHDPSTGVCEPFIYGGCQGNANNFPSLDACQSACRGGQPNLDACGGPGECSLLSVYCCLCQPVDARDFVAVARVNIQTYVDLKFCNNGGCYGDCRPSITEFTMQYFTATCRAGQCTVTDVRQTDLTACSKTEDCVLRDGVECCEGCDEGIVSLNRSADLFALVCSGGAPPPGCAPCVPVIPSSYTPMCIDGRCTVRFLR